MQATSSPAKGRNYVLGIDIGTTSVKAVIVDKSSKDVVEKQSQDSHANLYSTGGGGIDGRSHEQDVKKIISTVQLCVSRLPRDHLKKVSHIGISGQMHGVVLWKYGQGWVQNEFSKYDVGQKVSNLYTWQDNRCSSEFLSTLPTPQSHLRVSTGYGTATIFWLHRNSPEVLEQYDCAGTVMDLMIAMLCNLAKPKMSSQIAASWGYYNTEQKSWNHDLLNKHNFPTHLLPDIVDDPKVAAPVAGTMSTSWYGIPGGTRVSAALGDLQCSVLSSLPGMDQAIFNISTSAQISFIMPPKFCPPAEPQPTAIEYFPYFKGRYLAVAASLSGGNVLAWFVKTLQQWTHALGFGVPQNTVWTKILSLAAEVDAESNMEVVPSLYGERHMPDRLASVSRIHPGVLSLGNVTRAVCTGIVANIHSMMPVEFLKKEGITKIQGTGSAMSRNPILVEEVKRQFDLPFEQGDSADSAVGVARALLEP